MCIDTLYVLILIVLVLLNDDAASCLLRKQAFQASTPKRSLHSF